MMVKSAGRPAAPPNWRSRRWPTEWKVPPWTRAPAGPDEPLGAREHLAGGAAGEREQEDALGGDASLDEERDPVDERAGLARARAGDDEQGRVAEGDGARLIGVERRDEVVLVVRGQVPRARAIQARLVGHGPQYRYGPEGLPNPRDASASGISFRSGL